MRTEGDNACITPCHGLIVTDGCAPAISDLTAARPSGTAYHYHLAGVLFLVPAEACCSSKEAIRGLTFCSRVKSNSRFSDRPTP